MHISQHLMWNLESSHLEKKVSSSMSLYEEARILRVNLTRNGRSYPRNRNMNQCPYCAEEIQNGTSICPYCQADLHSPVSKENCLVSPDLEKDKPAKTSHTGQRIAGGIFIVIGVIALVSSLGLVSLSDLFDSILEVIRNSSGLIFPILLIILGAAIVAHQRWHRTKL